MNIKVLSNAVSYIEKSMQENKDYLIELDQRFGDGDLGLSMAGGFEAINKYFASCEEQDLGRALMKSSSVFNETAPSSLGTILSLFQMGMAKVLKGKTEADLDVVAEAMESGINKIMETAKSKLGEKTILDSLSPAVAALKAHASEGSRAAFQAAADAANAGCESTKAMRSVHGRAAYYGDKSIGAVDGGAVVGNLIFSSLNEYVRQGE